jgi:hypothetical protein
MSPKINATKIKISTVFEMPSRKLSLGGGGGGGGTIIEGWCG